ncbi:MAG: ATP-binding protein [Rhodospirillales bacterium]|jgi:light-regulated signal transduction histidine kinase (bacteriophytochrome)
MVSAEAKGQKADTDRRISALQRNLDELRRSNAELEQFAHVVSHDLREPLRMISSYAQLMMRRYGGKLDPDADAFLGFITEGAARMEHLIGDILDYSRAGRSAVTLAAIDSAEPLAAALADLSPSISDGGAHVSVGTMPTISADSSQIERLFANLVSNALKYRAADRAPEISISGGENVDGWHFVVRDNGQGIPATECERVFGAFSRLHGRDIPGTGLGLTICRKIVERHGGIIWAEPCEPVGTAFHFTLAHPQAGG